VGPVRASGDSEKWGLNMGPPPRENREGGGTNPSHKLNGGFTWWAPGGNVGAEPGKNHLQRRNGENFAVICGLPEVRDI